MALFVCLLTKVSSKFENVFSVRTLFWKAVHELRCMVQFLIDFHKPTVQCIFESRLGGEVLDVIVRYIWETTSRGSIVNLQHIHQGLLSGLRVCAFEFWFCNRIGISDGRPSHYLVEWRVEEHENLITFVADLNIFCCMRWCESSSAFNPLGNDLAANVTLYVKMYWGPRLLHNQATYS